MTQHEQRERDERNPSSGRPRASDDTAHALLQNLTVELFQTETSAARHCRREAERLEASAPRQVMLDVAEHADRVLKELPGLAERHGLPISHGGVALGALFSAGRERVLDHLVEAERSYRGTLLGMRHGVDLVTLFRHVAETAGHGELVSFGDAWLATRRPLVTRTEEKLVWFAQHSERAMAFAKPIPGLGQVKRVLGVRGRSDVQSSDKGA